MLRNTQYAQWYCARTSAFVNPTAVRMLTPAPPRPPARQRLIEDRDMAARLAAATDTVGQARRVPLILGGHDRKPAVEEEAGTLIVKPGARGRTAAVVDISWPAGAAACEPLLAAQLHSCEEYGGNAELDKVIERHMHILQEVQRAHLLELPQACRPLSSTGVLRRQTTVGTLLATCLRDAMGCDASVIDAAALLDGQEFPPDAERVTYGDLLRLVDSPPAHALELFAATTASLNDRSSLSSFSLFCAMISL